MIRISTVQKAALAFTGIAVIAIEARSQSEIVSNGEIIAVNGDQAPGLPAGCLLDGAGTFDLGVMDDAGNVFFRSRLTGTGVTATNERAYFVGTNRSNLALVVRSGDPVPTLSGGETLNTTTGTGIGPTMRISSTGQMFWISSFSGGASTSTNDSAIFTGTPGNFVIAAREGDPAPGTTGATLPNLSALTLQGTQLSPKGRITFSCSTVGGDTTSANNVAWFGGFPGALQMILRKGATLPSGHVIGTIGSQLFYNASGEAFHEETLALSSGVSPVSTASDRVLLVYSPTTLSHTILVREGDLAPGTLGAAIGLTSVNASPFSYGGSPWNNNGKALVWCLLAAGSGDTIVGTNDGIMYLAGLANPPAVVIRKGDAAPGMSGGETIAEVHAGDMTVNNNDRVAFQASLAGGTVTSADNSAIFFGGVGSLQLIAREGDAAPGTVGASLGNILGLDHFWLNDQDQVTFIANLIGGDVTGAANNKMLYAWEAGSGLTPIIRAGDVIEVTPGVFQTVGSWSGLKYSNGDARALSFNHLGKMTLRVNFTDGTTSAIMSVFAPKVVGVPYCLGDGSGTACPCGNNGAAGNGCASSNVASGGRLSGFGTATASPDDSLVLTASNIAGPGLFFQGTGQAGGGLGVVFGDGLLCVGGTLLRLGVVFPTGNSASYPGGLTPNPIHIGGGTAAGDVRTYQCWYRDAFVFCSPATYNLTQAVMLTWSP